MYSSTETLLDLVQVFLLSMIVVGTLFAAVMSDRDPDAGLGVRALLFGLGLIGWVLLTAISLAAVVALVIGGFWLWGLAFP